jgi:uncharacterized membrane protein YtjA (UPF0391 family)
MGLDFILFLILGLVVFVPLAGNARLVAMIVFVVIMVLWLVGGFAGWNMHLPVTR